MIPRVQAEEMTVMQTAPLAEETLAAVTPPEPTASAKEAKPEERIRTLIADDQLIAREALRRLLARETGLELVGDTESGPETVEAILRLQPDLVFLDVEMPGLDGFGVLNQIPGARQPAVVFVTASEHFAHQAFDVEAVDYLIKPCSGQRVHKALDRVRAQIRHRRAALSPSKPEPADDALVRPQMQRLAVKSGRRILFLRLADIEYVEAADNYVELHTGRETHLVRETMAVMESKLPGDQFLRISRSTIVNTEHIRELQPMFHGDYAVLLRNGARLSLSRSYREKFAHLC